MLVGLKAIGGKQCCAGAVVAIALGSGHCDEPRRASKHATHENESPCNAEDCTLVFIQLTKLSTTSITVMNSVNLTVPMPSSAVILLMA